MAGRIYNGIDKKHVEWRVLGWRIGIPTMLFVVGLAALLWLVSTAFGPTAAVIFLIPAVIALIAVVWLLNTIDPFKRLPETAAAGMLLNSLTRRGHDTLDD